MLTHVLDDGPSLWRADTRAETEARAARPVPVQPVTTPVIARASVSSVQPVTTAAAAAGAEMTLFEMRRRKRVERLKFRWLRQQLSGKARARRRTRSASSSADEDAPLRGDSGIPDEDVAMTTTSGTRASLATILRIIASRVGTEIESGTNGFRTPATVTTCSIMYDVVLTTTSATPYSQLLPRRPRPWKLFCYLRIAEKVRRRRCTCIKQPVI